MALSLARKALSVPSRASTGPSASIKAHRRSFAGFSTPSRFLPHRPVSYRLSVTKPYTPSSTLRYARKYSTSEEAKDESEETNESQQPETLAEKYNFHPSRESELEYLESLGTSATLTEEEKKFVRHRITKKGNIMTPPPWMVERYHQGRKTVFIAGAGGWLAQALAQTLESRGHRVVTLSRGPKPNWPADLMHHKQYFDVAEEGVPDCDALVQLTGQDYFTRHLVPDQAWEEEHYLSRAGITEMLAYHTKRTKWPPRVFIQASNAGIYPTSDVTEYDEKYSGGLGLDLIGSVNRDYESKSSLMAEMGIRTVQLRLGHVLGDRGIIQSVHKMDEKGRAFWSKIGSGDQWFPWIHVADAVDLMIHSIENENIRGIINGVAPQPIRQKQFANSLNLALPRKTWSFPMPETATHWMYPGRAHLLTEGRLVVPRVAQETNFRFHHPTIDSALQSIQPYLIPIQWKNPMHKYYNPNKNFLDDPNS